MTRALGLEVTAHHVRAAVLRGAYRKVELEGFFEETLGEHESPEAALKACVSKIGGGFDAVSCTIPGNKTFVHRVELPLSAEKKLSELLPFELEGELPLEIDEVVFDYKSKKRAPFVEEGIEAALEVLVVAARTEQVRAQIETVREALDLEPERVGSSGFELGQLVRVAPELKSEHPLALISLGYTQTDVCVILDGRVEHARTISRGIGTFPDGADPLIGQIRQTLSSYAASTGRSVGRAIMLGEGSRMSGMSGFLQDRLQLELGSFPPVTLENVEEVDRIRLPLFGPALSSAVHGVRGGGFDLRQGELAFERGYGFIKERAPLLGGLVGAILVSFLFATWAEGKALERENEALVQSLEKITQDTFGATESDPDEAEALLAKAKKKKSEDPMPYMDGFGAAVAWAETMPPDIKHDTEQFDLAKGKLKIRGVVDKTDEAQQIAKAFGEHRCIQEPKVTKISQVVNSERERYTLEATVHCPEDGSSDKKSKKKSGGSK